MGRQPRSGAIATLTCMWQRWLGTDSPLGSPSRAYKPQSLRKPLGQHHVNYSYVAS